MSHAPSCPQLFWPDGRRRGELVDSPPLPPFNPDRDLPLHMLSPLSEELADILGPVKNRMLEDHLRARKEINRAG